VSPARHLLLACCRAHWTPQRIEGRVRRAVDWDRLLESADRLAVTALLHTPLTQCVDPIHVPPAVLRRVGQLYYGQAARNARLSASFEQALAALSRSGVPVIVLKGLAIAQLVYDNIALRPIGDLDVLVPRRDLDLALGIVQELGYLADESSHPAAWYRRHHHHLVECFTRDRSCKVDVHHHIFPPAAGVHVPIEDFWLRARPATLGSATAMVLAPADLLLHLCVGLSAVERFVGGLRTLCDIAAAIKRYERELDWACLLESARTYDLEKHLYYGLWLAWDLVGAEVPAPVLDELSHSLRGRRVEALSLIHI